ncbi:hypothetical protein VC83_05911 [Pseudogymnoascus destructans]|uniref:Protein transport protein sec73 n=1 Tax=Pseudogymnoascus destructans TaxID=655981 RepID=A0A177A7V6_9PEZI|nr:uncharacterized protein VC83_05911 [Pseudogymnoascus destructans]OAF57114.1 hypothetical protein VC83_05911 [Pseudogymnoascus destructans]
MPIIPGLLRRRGQASETDLNRRHSLLLPSPPGAAAADSRAGRLSEQLPRRDAGASDSLELTPLSSAPAMAFTSPEETLPLPEDRPVSPPVQDATPRQSGRFSMMKFRHASDSQLSTRARQQAEADAAPPMPRPPEIITTAPTNTAQKKKSKLKLPGIKPSDSKPSAFDELIKASKKERRKALSEGNSSSRVTFDEPVRHSSQVPGAMPPPYGDDAGSTLALPVNRLSESSRSDGSSADNHVYAQTTTTIQTTHTTTTFFRLPRRKKPQPLFPLPPKVVHHDQPNSPSVPDKSGNNTSRASTDSGAAQTLRLPQGADDNEGAAHTHSAIAKASMLFAAPGSPLIRRDSTASNKSSPTRRGLRGRSSTLTSLRNGQNDEPLDTPPLPSSRTSTSTGRKSFGDIFNLTHRLRPDPMPHASGQASPLSATSKNNSIQITREPIIIPERHQDDSPAKYLLRLEEAVSRGAVASVLSKGSDTFSQQVLRSYMRGFGFFGDPMDMALRKLLMEVELPKETQHIDRCLQSFAHRYHECNPGIYASPEQAYFIAFSLLILHTDVFNKNNKNKMQKQAYCKNTQGEGIFDEILECFYDNISYTPFIHVEDDLDINGERIVQHMSKKKSLFPRSSIDPMKRPSKEPVDPYTLIIDSKLDSLRPNLKDVMNLEEHYSYLGTALSLNLDDLQRTFFRTGVLQIISARSRPDAFMSDKTAMNPEEAHPGIVDIKITKVGLLWRKDPKKKKTRSPWQEWGAILTGAQLYFFRNTAWIKSLIHQHDHHVKQGNDGIPVTFKPPIESFKPDALMSTDDAVALLDSTYKKHKNAFLFVRHGRFEETFLADNEDEMNDWLAKLNYAAAFRTAGVRMRGVVGGNYEGQRTRGIRRLGSANSGRSVQTPTGEVQIISGKIDLQMAQDILAARREIMMQKMTEAEGKLAVATKQLDAQLRNARHLLILAPIQAKTREQVVLAAGRMSAKLRWVRMEIWRLRCHRDILSMDLDEEVKHGEGEKVDPLLPTANLSGECLAKQNDRDSHAGVSSRNSAALSPQQSSQSQHPTPVPQASPNDFDIDDFFTSPSAAQSASTFHKAQAWELPPLKFDGPRKQLSPGAGAQPRSPVLSHTSSYPRMTPTASADPQRSVSSPQEDAGENIALEQAGLIDGTLASDSIAGEPPTTSTSDSTEKEKLERGKIRRSIHRTLRDAHVPTQHRSRKGKDSSSSGTKEGEEVARDDHLARGTGSFVIHGKKASVITFGDALANMSAEERMRLKKQAQAQAQERGTSESPAPKEFGREASLRGGDHRGGVDHRGSEASTNTVAARSFRELHNRLSAHAATLEEGGAGSDSDADADADAAMSMVSGEEEGVRTPLPVVEDVDEDEEGGRFKQAAFYTPEVPGTPAKEGMTPVKGKGGE